MGFDHYRCVLDRIFSFQNYRNTDVVSVSNNIISFSLPMKNYESESAGTFCRSFPTVFILKGGTKKMGEKS
jgi:hypothetical protein